MSDAIDMALRYVTDRHNELVLLRDQLAANRRRAMEYGTISEALHAETLIAGFEGEIKGLHIATTQLQMVRDNERIEP